MYMAKRVEQRLGTFHLNRLIGTGAFADVYQGTHIHLNTCVAIKVLRSHFDAQILESFLMEALHLSHLVHPHIIRVFDYGIEDEIPFLVMEYAPGGNLRQHHPPGNKVSLSDVVSYVSSLASALHYAHDQQLIHRDLKPENVLLGSKQELMLSDFGLAYLSSRQETPQTRQHVGTLAYTAPEQICGYPCPASDQYALAIMVYEWLCGGRPFVGSPSELLYQQQFAVPPSLCERSPDIPPAVEHVIFTGLAKDPTQRYVDIHSFATALAQASQGLSASSSPCLSVTVSSETDQVTSVLYRPQGPTRYLPTPLSPMIGREQELQAVRARLLRPHVRLLTLTGAPGVGKTRLALALSTTLEQTFHQGVYFVSLADVSDPEQLAPTLLHAFGLYASPESSPLELLIASLQEKHILLILDDFMHLLPAAKLIAALLTACPHLKILVTSRAILHLQGEYEFVVSPLPLPDLQHLPTLADLSQVPAVALFTSCAEALNQDFTLTQENATTISQICIQLEGLPLAIELAAARIKLFPPEILLARLEQSLEVLTNGKQNVPFHQSTLRDTIAWSYTHLTHEEQLLFRWLSVFIGAFTLEAVEEVMSGHDAMQISVLDGITALLDKSLLKRDEEKPELRLYLLRLIRQYGWECLFTCGELEQARAAHAHYYLSLVEQNSATVGTTAQTPWQKRLEREDGNIRAARQWLLEQRKIDASFLPGDTPSPVAPMPVLPEELTAREREVLHFLALGLSNKGIAEQLILSPFTVNRHVQSIYGKLGVSSRSAATRFAVEHHLDKAR